MLVARKRSLSLIGALMVLAVTARGQNEPEKGIKFLGSSARNEQRQWALLIGVNGYEEAGNLKFPGQDMEALRDCLYEAGFPEERVTTLHDDARTPNLTPTSKNINRELEALLGKFDPKTGKLVTPGKVGNGDLVVIAFSGHGVYLENRSYFCPSDAKLENPETLISVEDVYAKLNAVPARQKLLVVDACRNDPTRKKGTRGFDGAKQLVRSLEQPPLGILVLSSCTMGQYSFEDDQLKHGVFTYYMVEGLKGAADDDGDGRVTLLDLYRYAARQTEQRVARLFSDQQRPMLKGELSGDFEIGARHQRFVEVLDQGRKQFEQSKYDEAIAAFGQALKLAPRSVDARLERARTALEISQFKEAISDCEEALRIQPEAIEALVLRARAYRTESRFTLAQASIEQALRIEPRDAGAILERGFLSWNRTQPEQALADALQVLEIEPKNARAAYLRASALHDLGDRRAAVAAARAGLALLEPHTPADYLYRSGLTIIADPADDQKAIADLDTAMRLNPRDADFVGERGVIHYNHNRFKEAIADFEKAVSLVPSNATTHSNLGYAYLALNQNSKALSEFNRALELDGTHALAISGRGQAELHLGDPDKAMADFNRLLELKPKDASAHSLLGRALAWKGNFERAVHAYEEALRLDPDLVDAYDGLGTAYNNLKDYDRAIRNHTRAIELSPKHAPYYVNRGQDYYWKDQDNLAQADLNKALQLDPENADAYNLRGNILFSSGKYEEAIADYDRAIQREPNNSVIHTNRGNASYYNNDLEKAITSLDRAVELNPNYALAYLIRGKARIRGGKSGWEDDLKKARRLGSEDNFLTAVERRGVVFIANRTSSKTIYYYRWKLPDGTFTNWGRDEVEPGKTRYVWQRASSSPQIRFDGVTGNDGFDETILDLKAASIDMETNPDSLDDPCYAFSIDGNRQLLNLIDRTTEAAARQFTGVIVISNKTTVDTGKLFYSLRWRRADGSWTDWSKKELENGYYYIHSMEGAGGCQVEFDNIGGDGKYSGYLQDLQFNRIPSGREAKYEDGKFYYFQFDPDNVTLRLLAG